MYQTEKTFKETFNDMLDAHNKVNNNRQIKTTPLTYDSLTYDFKQSLISSGLDINSMNDDELLLLNENLLLFKNNNVDLSELLKSVVEIGNFELLKIIVYQTECEIYNSDELLLMATNLGYTDIVVLLLSKGAYVNVDYGKPLNNAIRSEGYSVELVSILLDNGAKVGKNLEEEYVTYSTNGYREYESSNIALCLCMSKGLDVLFTRLINDSGYIDEYVLNAIGKVKLTNTVLNYLKGSGVEDIRLDIQILSNALDVGDIELVHSMYNMFENTDYDDNKEYITKMYNLAATESDIDLFDKLMSTYGLGITDSNNMLVGIAYESTLDFFEYVIDVLIDADYLKLDMDKVLQDIYYFFDHGKVFRFEVLEILLPKIGKSNKSYILLQIMKYYYSKNDIDKAVYVSSFLSEEAITGITWFLLDDVLLELTKCDNYYDEIRRLFDIGIPTDNIVRICLDVYVDTDIKLFEVLYGYTVTVNSKLLILIERLPEESVTNIIERCNFIISEHVNELLFDTLYKYNRLETLSFLFECGATLYPPSNQIIMNMIKTNNDSMLAIISELGYGSNIEIIQESLKKE